MSFNVTLVQDLLEACEKVIRDFGQGSPCPSKTKKSCVVTIQGIDMEGKVTIQEIPKVMNVKESIFMTMPYSAEDNL